MKKDYAVCSYCGAEIKKNSKFCASCGSDEMTGWSESTYLDGIDLHDEDYEEIKDREFTNTSKSKKTTQIITGVVLLVITAFLLLATIVRL